VTPNKFEKSIKLELRILLIKSIFCLVYRDPEQFWEVDQADPANKINFLFSLSWPRTISRSRSSCSCRSCWPHTRLEMTTAQSEGKTGRRSHVKGTISRNSLGLTLLKVLSNHKKGGSKWVPIDRPCLPRLSPMLLETLKGYSRALNVKKPVTAFRGAISQCHNAPLSFWKHSLHQKRLHLFNPNTLEPVFWNLKAWE
jgi:hypothetical protein